MKTLLFSFFILPVLFLFPTTEMEVEIESQAEPDVKLTVVYSHLTQPQVHIVPMSELLALIDQILSEPEAALVTTCSYEFAGKDECRTGPYPTCEEAFAVFRDCACESPNFDPPASWDCPD